MSVHPLSVSYHDNVDTEQRIIVDCLGGETLRIALGWDMCIFIGRERLTELRDKITAFLDGSAVELDQSPAKCLRCGGTVTTEAVLCGECQEEEKAEDAERNRGTQTLADVGMCEADFL